MTGGFIDARTADHPADITGSVCIVGGGAAGITLARELARHVPDVVLVESGAHDIEGRTQGLYAGRNLGLPYFDLLSCRLRYMGGTTNHWSGYCRANDPIDYEGRADPGLPAWPIRHADLAPYLDAAAGELGLPDDGLDARAALRNADIAESEMIEARSDILKTKVFHLADRIRLAPINRDALAGSDRLRSFLNLNVTHVQLGSDGGAVDHLVARTLNGRAYRVRARAYVLCCHAIENARLLLASNDVMTPGIGNAHDHVGRYFMDHIYIEASRFVPGPAFPKLYNREWARGRALNANISFTDAQTHAAGLLQYYCRFNPQYMSPEAAIALSDLRASYMEPGDLDFLADMAEVLGELPGAVRKEIVSRDLMFVQPMYYGLEHRLEQWPNPDSRVVLSDRLDALGNRIADLDWRIGDVDIESFRKGQAMMGREMAALGFGRLEAEDITRDLVENRVKGHYHHIGTTRMSADPAAGVVDADCRMHGIGNLYVGGSSTFPTAGYSGPTMMIMAMALRLADHLRGQV